MPNGDPGPVDRDRPPESGRSGVAGDLARESWRRPWYAHVTSYAISVLLIVPAIWLCDWVLPGFKPRSWEVHSPSLPSCPCSPL